MRWLADRQQLTTQNDPKNRFLNVVFMATSPRGVTPELDFEAEEGQILTATTGTKKNLCLTVEESGCLQNLGALVNEVQEPFDVVHLTGHARISEGKPYFLTEIDLGLMASSSEVEEGERTYRVSRILPRIIPSIQLPPEPQVYPLYQKAWEKLSELWGDRQNRNEEQWQEIFRLKLADRTNPQRFREGFKQMISVQFRPCHMQSDRAFEAELRKKKSLLNSSLASRLNP